MADDKKIIRLVFDGSKTDPKEAIRLERGPAKKPDLFNGFHIQEAVNGGYVLTLEHTGSEPNDLYYCESKQELLELLGKVLK